MLHDVENGKEEALTKGGAPWIQSIVATRYAE
jgi:hypothetical protein